MHAHSKDPSSPSAAIRSGREAIDRGAWEEARHHFRQALAEGAGVEAWDGLGLMAHDAVLHVGGATVPCDPAGTRPSSNDGSPHSPTGGSTY